MFWEDEIELNTNTLQCASCCCKFDVTGAAAPLGIVLGNTKTIIENEATASSLFLFFFTVFFTDMCLCKVEILYTDTWS